jgi:hypothetical protein
MEVIHIVHRHIDTFTSRMLEFERRKEPLNVTWAFPALTGDIIMDYFFGFNYGSTKDPEFSSFHAAFKVVGLTGHIAMQFPWFLPVIRSSPKVCIVTNGAADDGHNTSFYRGITAACVETATGLEARMSRRH